jgi:hypothetical protein
LRIESTGLNEQGLQYGSNAAADAGSRRDSCARDSADHGKIDACR